MRSYMKKGMYTITGLRLSHAAFKRFDIYFRIIYVNNTLIFIPVHKLLRKIHH